MNKYRFLKTLIISFSCSLISCSRLISTSNQKSSLEHASQGFEEHQQNTVSLDGELENEKLGQVEVNENGIDASYGPRANEDGKLNTDTKKEKVRGLFLGGVGYETFSSLQAVQELQSKGVRFHVYSGSGFGLLLATFLAAGKSVDQIEWFFFKLKKDLESYAIYSEEWSSFLIKNSMDFIKSSRMEDLSGTLVVPLYHNPSKKIHYFTKGEIGKYLQASLSLDSEALYAAAIHRSLFATLGLNVVHSDQIFCLDNLGKKIKFKNLDHYLLGLANRLTIMRETDKKTCHHLISLDTGAQVDDLGVLDKFRVLERKQIDSQVNYIVEKMSDEKNP